MKFKSILVIALFLILKNGHASTPVSTTTTTYDYNQDGALTLITTQVDENTPTKQYLTWDNFTPDSSDPSQGTVSSGVGHVLGIGPNPGIDTAQQAFSYDAMHRLQQVNTSNEQVSYQYHPTWSMASSTLQSGSALHFYYHPGRYPVISNIEQADTGVVSGRIGPLRSFSDGGSQILLSPRKDISSVYTPDQETVQSYHYDPYGGNDQETKNAYDVHNNPHQFADEYKDAAWNGYYFRDRWYQSEWQQFLSRDPEANLNRYAYAGANPIARIDPSGRKYKSYVKVMRPLSNFLHKTMGCRKCDTGRVFLGPLFSPLSLIADPAGFYHTEIARDGGFGVQMLLGTVAMQLILNSAIPEENYIMAFGFRILGDEVFGVGNSAVAATSHNYHRFGKRAFFQGLEYTAGGMFYNREVLSIGYRPFNLTMEDIEKATPEDDNFNVYRVKTKLSGKFGVLFKNQGPLGDYLNRSFQHELLIGVNKGSVFISEVAEKGVFSGKLTGMNALNYLDDLDTQGARFRFLGKATETELTRAAKVNPIGVQSDGMVRKVEDGEGKVKYIKNLTRSRRNALPYSTWSRNCQMHVEAMTNTINFLNP